MILLLGATGYIGQAFQTALEGRSVPFTALSRSQVDYSHFPTLFQWLQNHRPDFVINAAGYTGKPNVDACETARADTLLGNALFPQTVTQACAALDIPWGHVSSGCIFTGGWVRDASGSGWRVEKDLMRPDIRQQVIAHPEELRGFSETDTPNFSFRDPPCSFYSGSKALGEEAICGIGESYIWRLRIPFDEDDSSRNYLSKVQRYAKVYDNFNSLSHRGDFVNACLDSWRQRIPFGIYNMTNPGFVSARDVIEMVQEILKPKRQFEFWQDDHEFYQHGASTPRSNCLLDTQKLAAAGIQMRPVREAVADALTRWTPDAR